MPFPRLCQKRRRALASLQAGFLDGASKPPTWTAEDGPRGWLAKVLFPARDVPRWLALFFGIAVCSGVVQMLAHAISERSYLRLAYVVVVFVFVAVPYLLRVAVAVLRDGP